MAEIAFPDLPGWNFAVDERSANVYEVVATSTDGRSVRLVGPDPYVLLDEARADAERSEHRTPDL